MPKQKFKMTFKCSDCKSTFEKITTNQNLMNPRCPYCKETNEATKLHRVGDGPVSEKDTTKLPFSKSPNVIYRCESCETKIKIFEQPEEKIEKCPNCDSERVKFVCHIDRYTSQASKTQNKAIDATADIVMEDYKLGDLKSTVRTGESMAPRLDPARQTMADNMFSKKKGPMVGFDLGTGRASPIKGNMNMSGMVRSAMAGAYRDGAVDPVAAIQSNRQRMPINIINKNSN